MSKAASPSLNRSLSLSGGLLFRYPGSEGSGTTLHDISGNGLDATMQGTLSWGAADATNAFGEHVVFDGGTGSRLVTGSTSLTKPQQVLSTRIPFTFGCYCYFTSLPDSIGILFEASPSLKGSIWNNFVGVNDGSTNSIPLVANTPYVIMIVMDGVHASTYIGTPGGTLTLATPSTANVVGIATGPITFGSYATGGFEIVGSLDAITGWDRGLLADELAAFCLDPWALDRGLPTSGFSVSPAVIYAGSPTSITCTTTQNNFTPFTSANIHITSDGGTGTVVDSGDSPTWAESTSVVDMSVIPGEVAGVITITNSVGTTATATVAVLPGVPYTTNVDWFGDSRCFGINAGKGLGGVTGTHFVGVAMGLLGPGYTGRNLGQSGYPLESIASRYAAQTPVAGLKNVAVIACWCVNNWISTGVGVVKNPATVYADLVAFVAQLRANGYTKVVIATEPAGYTDYASRAAINALVRAGWSTFADGIADFSADPTIGPDGQEQVITLFADEVHPTEAGHLIAGNILAPVVRNVNLGGSGSGVYPVVADVRLGTVYGPTSGSTGSLHVPTAAQVLATVAVDATTGTVVLPTAGQVISTATYGPGGATSGSFVEPTTSQVQSGVTFGPGSSLTGSYAGGGSTPATGLSLQLGAPSGYTGQVIDLILSLTGGTTLSTTLNYSIAGLPGSPLTGTISTGSVTTITNFTVGSAGTLTPILSISSGGNAGMTVGTTPSTFTASALPSGGGGSGITLAALQSELDTRGLTSATTAKIDVAVSTRSTLAGPTGFSSLVIAGGGVSLNLAQPVPMRDQTGITAPTVGDALAAGQAEAAGAESKPNTPGSTTLTKKHADGSTMRTFTLDSGTLPTSRS